MTPELMRPELLHELFEQQADIQPNAVALVCNDRQITYTELELQANRLAHFLRSKGVGRGDSVAILLPRSIEVYIDLLGILKAGADYVPLDPTFPVGRIEFILDDCRVKAVLTTKSLAAKAGTFQGEISLWMKDKHLFPPS